MKTSLFVFAVAVFVFLGCGGGQISEDKAGEQEQGSDQAALPEGHPPMAGSSGLGSDAPTDDNALPLKLTGLSSLAESSPIDYRVNSPYGTWSMLTAHPPFHEDELPALLFGVYSQPVDALTLLPIE